MSITREQAATWFETMHPPGPAAREMYRMAAKALLPVSRERIERMRGEWVKTSEYMPIFGCSKCGERNLFRNGDNVFSDFCPHCGAPMTDEAVEITMKRLEAMKDADD